MEQKRLYFYYFFVIFIFGIQNSKTTCPAGGVQSIVDANICYSFYSVQLQFADAEQTCTALNGHLASVSNGFVNVFLTGKFWTNCFFKF